MSAWLLPDHIADVLPDEARHIEHLRRRLLDVAQGYGYQLVIPPLVEHLQSLLSGTGEALDLATFKLIDQTSGRTLGVRADTTPQVARIDAHLLNRQGVARLCYCGPVLHTRPAQPHATREPLQFGAELYGHAGEQADLEVLLLAVDALEQVGVAEPVLDLGCARVLRSVLQPINLSRAAQSELHDALAAKDRSTVRHLLAGQDASVRNEVVDLIDLYGGPEVVAQAQARFSDHPERAAALATLAALVKGVQAQRPGLRLSVDLADLRGYAYYSGPRFSVYAPGLTDALARGGRYDEVGAVFGRSRAAVGFSLDVRQLAAAVPAAAAPQGILAPALDGSDAALSADLARAVAALRRQGESVVCALPGHDAHLAELGCDRVLAAIGTGAADAPARWVVRPL